MSAKAQFCDVRSTNVPTVFNENEFVLNILKTRAGAILWQATHISMMLTSRPREKLNGDDRAPYYHFRKVSLRCPDLNPHTRKLTDFIQVLPRCFRSMKREVLICRRQEPDTHLSYKYANVVYLTLQGVNAFVQESRNKNALENKESLLAFLHAQHDEMKL